MWKWNDIAKANSFFHIQISLLASFFFSLSQKLHYKWCQQLTAWSLSICDALASFPCVQELNQACVKWRITVLWYFSCLINCIFISVNDLWQFGTKSRYAFQVPHASFSTFRLYNLLKLFIKCQPVPRPMCLRYTSYLHQRHLWKSSYSSRKADDTAEYRTIWTARSVLRADNY